MPGEREKERNFMSLPRFEDRTRILGKVSTDRIAEPG